MNYKEWRSSIKAVLIFNPSLIEKPECLSPKEREIFWRIASGQIRKVMSHELKVSTRTCEAHVANIYKKIPGLKDSKATFGVLAMEIILYDETSMHLLREVSTAIAKRDV